VRHYLAIMEARLGERLQHAVTLDPSAAALMLPPGVLLTLVENALEHGVSRALAGGRVELHAARDGKRTRITVQDDGPGLGPGWSEGVGLRNARERLQHRFGAAASLTLAPRQPKGCVATVSIDESAA
jgi:sensor histidine kinase YesM